MNTPTTYETHLTLDVSCNASIESARLWADESGLKWTEIELSHGDHLLQPMITYWGNDSLDSQHVKARCIEKELKTLSIQVVRVKTETEASTSQLAESGQYFECHVKLHLKSCEDWDAVRRVAEVHSAHVSRNARRIRDDGTEERFLTLRSYECDGSEAQLKHKRLLDSVRANGLAVMEVESEFVVFDSNLGLDAGWETSHV